MKKTGIAVLMALALMACRNDNIPDVSGIRVPLEVRRFEQDFFAMDTGNVMMSLQRLRAQYPVFLNDFLYNILELPPVTDTSVELHALIKMFIADYKPILDSAKEVFGNFEEQADEVRQGLRFVKYYFPAYKAPARLITFIGPLEGYSDVITANALAVGLQLHMGSRFSYYTSEVGQSAYASYISRRFTPQTIAVNCMKNIIADISPDRSAGRPLIEQMVEAGKRLYVLDKILPYTHDTLKIGYTANQLKGCYNNEGRIWNFFVSNNFLFTIEPALINGFMNDAPGTPELGEGSPGAIGLFTGWQIVKEYMAKNDTVSLPTLLKTGPRAIFEKSKYKPN